MLLKHSIKQFLKLAIIFALFVHPASAVDFHGLFVTEKVVKDESLKERRRAFLEGFDEIITRLSLSRKSLDSQEIKSARNKVTDFISGYTYETRELPTTESELNTKSTVAQYFWAKQDAEENQGNKEKSEKELIVKINFSEEDLKSVLYSAQIPYLSEARPTSVFWIKLDMLNSSNIKWLGDGDSHVVTLLEDSGASIGLPVVVPLFDYMDPNISLSSDDSVLKEIASKRYNTDIVITGSLSEFAGMIKGSGFIYSSDSVTPWKLLEQDMNVAVNSLVEQTASHLLEKYSIGKLDQFNNDTELVLSISGLSDLMQYHKVLNYLGELPGVESVNPGDLGGDTVVFTVKHKRAKHALLRAIKLDKVLFQEQLIEHSEPFERYNFRVS